MPRLKPPIHGRDHRPGGADPIPGLEAELHWGVNNDDDAVGLTLNAHNTVTVDADTDNIDLTTDASGVVTIQTDTARATIGPNVIALNADGSIDSTSFDTTSIFALNGIGLDTRWTAAAGGPINVYADNGLLLDGGKGGVTLQAPEHAGTGGAGNIIAKLTSGKSFIVKNAAGTAVFEVDENGTITPGGGAVSSVFGRSGAVAAVTGDYGGVVAAFLTGATSASRYVGATTSGAPVSGTFATGDFIVARDGHVFVCTSGGTPGTWADVAAGAGASFATPAIVLGSSAAAGSASTVIRSDATIAAFDATAPTTQAFGDSAVVGTAAFAARRDHKHAMPANVTEANISLAAANTTNDVTITKHGFVPIAPNDTAKFLRGDGTWNAATLPAGSTAVATDVIWDTKGDLAAATGADAAVKVAVGTDYDTLRSLASATPGVAWQPGAPVLLYDYLVSGSDKTSIDTGADTPQAGIAGTSNFPALRVLEVWILSRTDEALAGTNLFVTLNNDTSSIYDRQLVTGVNVTASAADGVAAANWSLGTHGASGSASYAGSVHLTIPGYADTTFWKTATAVKAIPDATNTNATVQTQSLGYRSTSAIVRLAITTTVSQKFKVGTRLLIYAR